VSDQPTTAALPLIEALLDGTIDDVGFVKLEVLLRDDAAARSLYLSYANLNAALPGIVGQAPQLSLQITDADETSAIETQAIPQADLMAMLLRSEEQAKPLDPALLAAPERGSAPKRDHDGKLARQDLFAAGSYLLRHSFTPKLVATLATAAVLLLGVVLAVVLLTGPDTADPVANSQIESNDPDRVVSTPIVATLTATHNAQWAERASARGSLTPGSKLHPNQRLTLTAGFAEITTARGAVAILEAPCTIQMIDSPNAIRLHAGKMVGVCETESSKGFVVKTDQAEITDIGTEFGVDVSDDGLTRLHVFDGEVRVAVKDQHGKATDAVTLRIGQAVNIGADTGLLAVAIDPDRFAGHRDYKLTGQIKESFAPSVSLISGDTESSAFMLLVPEQKSVRLKQPLQVVIPPESPVLGHDHPQKTLAVGTTVDSYTIHFDADEQLRAGETLTLRAEIRFRRPILGVVLDSDQYHETAQLLGKRDVQYNNPDTPVNVEVNSDQVMISPDGKTLRLELTAKGASPGIDQLRILVQAK
jgi:hypothetical protein